MKHIKDIYIPEYLALVTLFIVLPFNMQAQSNIRLSLQEIVDILALDAPETQILRLNFENELLQFENYKKGFLPAVSISMSPVNFNRSIVKLQQATDGQYNYVEDYSSSSNAGISVQQKIPFTGGTLSASSNLSYLNEFSQSRHSFSSTPFTISYSQQLFGGGRTMQMEKTIEYKKNEENIREYCIAVSGIQQKALNLFMDVFLASLEKTVTSSNRQATDSLFSMAEVRYKNKRITESDFRQIELQAVNNEYLEENTTKNFEDALRTLATFLGLFENYENAVVETPKFDQLLQIEPENVTYYIRKNNPAMLSKEIQRLEAEKDLYSAELQNRFNANINLSYGMNKYAQTISEVYSNPSRQQSVSVGFSIPFSLLGINRNNALIAKNRYRSSIISIEQELDEFEDETVRTVNNYNHNLNLWHIAERSYLLSQKQYNLTVHEFSIGRATAYELITSQQEQSSAIQKYYQAIRNTLESYFIIREMTLYDFEKNLELIDIFLK